MSEINSKDITEKVESSDLTGSIKNEIKNEIDSIKKEIPTSKDVESFLDKIKNSLLSYYSSFSESSNSILNSTSKSLLSVYNNSLSALSKNTSKSIDFSKYYYSKASQKVNEYPLIAYDALYLTACSILGGLAYAFHKNYLVTKACDHCHSSNSNKLHILASVGVCLSILGVGNYLYLKKSDSKKA